MATPGHSKASRFYFDGYRVSQAVMSGNQDIACDAAEATAIEDEAKVHVQGKVGMTCGVNGFLDVADSGWDVTEFAAINDGGHVVTICGAGTTTGSSAYVTYQHSTGDSRPFDQANIVLLNWSGAAEEQFGRGKVITTGEKAFTADGSDSGVNVGATSATQTCIVALHVVAYSGLDEAEFQIDESEDDGSVDVYAKVEGWTIYTVGSAVAGTDVVTFTGTGSAFFVKTGATEAWKRVTADVTGTGSVTVLGASATAAG